MKTKSHPHQPQKITFPPTTAFRQILLIMQPIYLSYLDLFFSFYPFSVNFSYTFSSSFRFLFPLFLFTFHIFPPNMNDKPIICKMMVLWTYQSHCGLLLIEWYPPPPSVGWLNVKILPLNIPEIIRQRVLSHLARPAHIWNSSPGVFYSPAQQAGLH